MVENELKKSETLHSICFCGKSHFEDDGTQNNLVFPTTYRYFEALSINDSNVVSWKSNGLSYECIKPLSTSNKMLNPSVNYVGTKASVKFNP